MKKLLLSLLLMITCIFSACKEDPQIYHKADAIEIAEKKLAKYAAEEDLDLTTFKGPFAHPLPKGEVSDTVAYQIYYIAPKHVFYYDQFTNNSHGSLKSNADPSLGVTERLRSLDPYGDNYWPTEETP